MAIHAGIETWIATACGLAMTDCDFCSTSLRRYGLYGLGDFFSIRLGLHGFEVLQNTLPVAPD